mmetsp:Transcript_7525/g.28438  ORF Transcript_7525/g.28438 Transcript_7525/m.28438 type:complete len:236 (-) Transcript_7525:207-914(-)
MRTSLGCWPQSRRTPGPASAGERPPGPSSSPWTDGWSIWCHAPPVCTSRSFGCGFTESLKHWSTTRSRRRRTLSPARFTMPVRCLLPRCRGQTRCKMHHRQAHRRHGRDQLHAGIGRPARRVRTRASAKEGERQAVNGANDKTLRLGWVGLDWTGLDWTGLNWTGLISLAWLGLAWLGLVYLLSFSPSDRNQPPLSLALDVFAASAAWPLFPSMAEASARCRLAFGSLLRFWSTR